MIFKRSSFLLVLLALFVSTNGSYQNRLRGESRDNREVTLEDKTKDMDNTSGALQMYSSEKIENENKRIIDTMHRATGAIIVKKVKKRQTPGFGAQSIDDCNVFQSNKWVNKTPPGAYDYIRMGKVNFGERFDGLTTMTPNGVIGLSDYLRGEAKTPLTLTSNFNKRENLYVTKFCENGKCGIQVMGRGPSGFKGPGAISLMFRKNMRSIQLSFRANGASKAEALFFSADGTYIDKLAVDIEKTQDYSFTHPAGEIRGIAIFPVGDALKWFKYSLVGLCYK